MYFRIMNASSGGIGIEYLERQPFAKIAWLSRLAEVSDIKRQLDFMHGINTGYHGNQKTLDKLQYRLENLTLEKPKRDVAKLKKYGAIQKAKGKAARAKKREKKRKRIKLDLGDK